MKCRDEKYHQINTIASQEISVNVEIDVEEGHLMVTITDWY